MSLLRLWPHKHVWRLEHGIIGAWSYWMLKVIGGDKSSTATRENLDGSCDIWAWKCERCGKQKQAMLTDLPLAVK